MSVDVFKLSKGQAAELLSREEGHFFDVKSVEIAPAKLTNSLSAFSNADGGEIIIGLSEKDDSRIWRGFFNQEAANGHIQALECLFPLGASIQYAFLICDTEAGYLLQITIQKTSDIRYASDKKAYLRRGAQNLPQTSPDQIKRLEFNKGLASFEDTIVPRSNASILAESAVLARFIADVVPSVEPVTWIRKQQLLQGDAVSVCGLLLFADEPQAFLPKAAIKIYRYNTNAVEGTRDTLAFDPIAIEQDVYSQIFAAVAKTKEIAESTRALGESGLQTIEYPQEAIHEIITNAVIHRDYSISDDIHVRIFDNRIEVVSPGTLPGHVTRNNILNERFARNSKLVRLINKFRNATNKDVGEGINTAFEAMRKLRLRDPIIDSRENSVVVMLRHERLGSAEELIVDYLRSNEEVTNAIARKITHIGSENSVKRIFQKLQEAMVIERIPGRSQAKTAYRRGPKFH